MPLKQLLPRNIQRVARPCRALLRLEALQTNVFAASGNVPH